MANKTTGRKLPTFDELPPFKDFTGCAWEVWGKDDQLGTVNLLTEEVVKEMAKGTDRPIIFPLSNPTRLVEVTPEQANTWTNGKALMATGSPFPPCKMPNGKMYEIAECNST